MIKNDDRETNVVSENEYLPVEIDTCYPLRLEKVFPLCKLGNKKNLEPF